jgi:hypothetical protein
MLSILRFLERIGLYQVISGKAKLHAQSADHIDGVFTLQLRILWPGILESGVNEISLLERETGFEPATSTLARLHSTAELFPLNREV